MSLSTAIADRVWYQRNNSALAGDGGQQEA